ncbi:MAG TPA: hypothetical protein VH084_29965 [Mycobacterium sp.]|jgi:hypothetical protein|nr:hypothetical protein [Mycobacterium sp.]
MSERLSVEIGTVEVLRSRVYKTDTGDMFVEPGTYPVLRHPDKHVSFLMTGRSSHRTPGSFERLEAGLFAVTNPLDHPAGELKEFPYGYWSPRDFANLQEWEGAIEGHPGQRLRITLKESVDA